MYSILDDYHVSCKNGQAISIFEDFCNKCQECPILPFSMVAFASNCSKISNHVCPFSKDASKICIDKLNVSITDYCSDKDGNKYWKCPMANKGLKHEQCYSQ